MRRTRWPYLAILATVVNVFNGEIVLPYHSARRGAVREAVAHQPEHGCRHAHVHEVFEKNVDNILFCHRPRL